MDHHLLAYYVGIAILLYNHVMILLNTPQPIDFNPNTMPPDQMHAMLNLLALAMIYAYKSGKSVYWYYLAVAIIVSTHWNIMTTDHAKYSMAGLALIVYWFLYISNKISF